MSGDHDADAIRNRRQTAAGERLLALVPRIEAMFAAIDGEGREGDEFGKQAFDLGNRVEDALKRLDEKVREVGDLPDRLRAACEETEAQIAAIHRVTAWATDEGNKLSALRAQIEDERKAQKPPQAPGMAGTGGQDGPAAEKLASGQNSGDGGDVSGLSPADPVRIAAENQETAKDVAARTEPSGSADQAAVQAQPDAPKA